MPRLNQTTADRQRTAVVHALDCYTADRRRAGDDSRQIAERLGFDYQLLRLRKQSPENFKLGELQRIANVLNVSLATLIGASDE